MPNWWEYPTNYSNGTAVDGVGKMFFKYPSYILNDWLGAGIILLLWLAIFGVSFLAGSRKAMLVASFITFIFSVYLFMMGILNPVIPIILIVLTIIGAIGTKEQTQL